LGKSEKGYYFLGSSNTPKALYKSLTRIVITVFVMKKLAATLLFLLFLAMPILAANDGPVAYLTETVIADYNQDGTNRTTLSMKGEVEVMVPNTADVLQNIRINVTNAIFDLGAITTLTTNETFLDFAESSGGVTDFTKMYTNTSVTGTTDYNITNADAGRPLELNATFTNYQGGQDVYSSDNIETALWGAGNNTMQFWVTVRNPSKTNGVNPFTLTIKMKNITVINGFNVTSDDATIAPGTFSLTKAAYVSTITGTGLGLGTSDSLTVEFNGTITEGGEVNGKTVSFDIDAYITDENDAGGDTIATDVGVLANYSNMTGTISVATPCSKLSSFSSSAILSSPSSPNGPPGSSINSSGALIASAAARETR